MRSAILAVCMCLSATAFAQSNSGAELRNSGSDFVRICGPSAQGQPSSLAAACNIWLAGVVDGLQAYNSNTRSLPLFDASDITVGQVAKLVVKYVSDHPDRAQLPTAAVILGALIENFPRRESAPKQ